MSVSASKKNVSLKYLLDTSAVMTFSEDEAGSETVADILEKAKLGKVEVYISFMSVMEACYKVYQCKDEPSARKMFNYLSHLPMERVDVNNDLIFLSSRLKAVYSISMADAWILATAVQLGAHLVHKDPEFEQVKNILPQIILPYKTKKE